jgi:hypothetical protein
MLHPQDKQVLDWAIEQIDKRKREVIRQAAEKLEANGNIDTKDISRTISEYGIAGRSYVYAVLDSKYKDSEKINSLRKERQTREKSIPLPESKVLEESAMIAATRESGHTVPSQEKATTQSLKTINGNNEQDRRRACEQLTNDTVSNLEALQENELSRKLQQKEETITDQKRQIEGLREEVDYFKAQAHYYEERSEQVPNGADRDAVRQATDETAGEPTNDGNLEFEFSLPFETLHAEMKRRFASDGAAAMVWFSGVIDTGSGKVLSCSVGRLEELDMDENTGDAEL